MIAIAHSLFAVLASLFLALTFVPYASATHNQHRHRATTDWYTQYKYLNVHNTVRDQHGASDLAWSSALAEAAEAWVSGCSFTNSGGVLSDGTQYGENVVAATGDMSISGAVASFVADESAPCFIYNYAIESSRRGVGASRLPVRVY